MKNKELLMYFFRILKWKFGDTSPIVASLKLTYRCTLKCIHCPWRKLTTKKEMSIIKWKSIIKNLHKTGIRVLIMEGGEPTLFQGLQELVAFAQNLNMRVIIATNATIPLVGLSPDAFLVSIDGPEKEHNAIRGKDSYQRVLENLKNTESNVISLTTINRLNYNSIDRMINDIEPYVNTFSFTLFYPYDNIPDISLSDNQLELLYINLNQLKNKYNVLNSEETLSYSNWKCKPWLLVLIEPDGTETQGCFVKKANSTEKCSRCQLACYKEMMMLANGNLQTWYMFNQTVFQ